MLKSSDILYLAVVKLTSSKWRVIRIERKWVTSHRSEGISGYEYVRVLKSQNEAFEYAAELAKELKAKRKGARVVLLSETNTIMEGN